MMAPKIVSLSSSSSSSSISICYNDNSKSQYLAVVALASSLRDGDSSLGRIERVIPVWKIVQRLNDPLVGVERK